MISSRRAYQRSHARCLFALYVAIATLPFTRRLGDGLLLGRITLNEICGLLFLATWAAHRLRWRERPRDAGLSATRAAAWGLLAAAFLSRMRAGTERLGEQPGFELAIFAYLVVLFTAVCDTLRTEADAVSAIRVWIYGFAIVLALGTCEATARLCGLPFLLWPDEGPALRFALMFDSNAQLATYVAPSALVALAYVCCFPNGPARTAALLGLWSTPLVLLFASRRSILAATAIAGTVSLAGLATIGRARTRGLVVAALVLGGTAMLVHAHPPLREYFVQRVSVLQPAAVAENEFIVMQANAAWSAFASRPFTGIGYAGFWGSEFDPTGHEIHSTVTALLAETGVIGLMMYALFMLSVLSVTLQPLLGAPTIQWRRFWVCIAGLNSALLVSAFYTRQTRDRTFWVLLALVLTLARERSRSQGARRRARGGREAAAGGGGGWGWGGTPVPGRPADRSMPATP